MKKAILLSIFLCSFSVKAQENLLNLLGNDNEPMYISYLFKGTKVVNGQSVELPSKGVLQFTIQHRFGTLNSSKDYKKTVENMIDLVLERICKLQ